MKKQLNLKRSLIVIICGIVIGFINGFFGGGGGMVCVPLCEYFLKLKTKNAHATTIAVILPISIISSVIYSLTNNINYLELLYVSLGVCIGGVVGALLLKKLNSKIIQHTFIFIMIFTGIVLIVR